MNGTDDLHRLIQSLNPAQKRYFKLFASKQGLKDSKYYVLLFDSVDKAKVYDEKVLKKKLNNPALVKIFPQVKNYLHNLIMRSMRIYKSESDVLTMIFEMIQDAKFYKEKGLHDLQIKTLKKAVVLTEEFDLVHYNLIVLIYLKEAEFNINKKESGVLSEAMHLKEDRVLENILEETKLCQIYYRLWGQYIADPLLNDQQKISAYNALKKSPLLENYDTLHTFNARWFFLRSHALICRFNNDNTGALPYYERTIQLFEEQPHQKNNELQVYKTALHNYLSASHRSSAYYNFLSVMEKIKILKTTSRYEEIHTFHFLSINKLLFILNTSNFSAKKEIITEIQEGMVRYKGLLKDHMLVSLHYNMIVMAFITDDFPLALDLLTTLLNLQAEARKDLQYGAKLFLLIVHYELGHHQLLNSLIRNTVRSLQKDKLYYPFERLLTGNLKKLLKSLQADHAKIFSDFHTDLVLLRESDPAFKFVIMPETLAWIQSKIYHTSITVEIKKFLQAIQY